MYAESCRLKEQLIQRMDQYSATDLNTVQWAYEIASRQHGNVLRQTRDCLYIVHPLSGRHIHTSFQIRLPFVKGMLHQVDFHSFLIGCGARTVTDIWGVVHRVNDVDIILTKSMFKGYGWLTDSDMT